MTRRLRPVAVGDSGWPLSLSRSRCRRRHCRAGGPGSQLPPVVDDGHGSGPLVLRAGACTAFAPIVGNNHRTVFLDAGHGGIDPGGVGTTEAGQTIYESDVNLAIVLDTMALLRDHGYRIVVSRTKTPPCFDWARETPTRGCSRSSVRTTMSPPGMCAPTWPEPICSSGFTRMPVERHNAGSVTVYDPDRSFSTDNLKLANPLQGDVLSAMNAHGWQIPNDGVQPDGTFGSAVGNPASGTLAAEADSYDHLMLLGPAVPCSSPRRARCLAR